MDIRTPQELDAAVDLQRLNRLTALLTRARRRGFSWRPFQLLPFMLAPVVLVSFGRQQAVFNLAASFLFLVLGLVNLRVADRVDALVEVLEVRGLLGETPPADEPRAGQVSRDPGA